MPRLKGLTQKRLEKLERIKARGIDPYPHRYLPSHNTQEAISLFLKEERGKAKAPVVSLAGRIKAVRDMGKLIFMDLMDGRGKLQICFQSSILGEEAYETIKDLDIGDIVGVEGRLFRTQSGEITLLVQNFTLLAKSLHPLPEKWHGLVDVEKRYRQRYLDLLSNPRVREVFEKRSHIISTIRKFFDSKGFLEVETPVFQQVAGGAAARPFQTYHYALGEELYLRIATELHLKRLIIGGFDKVYEIGRVFRNEGISPRHNPEFTTLESYEAYADYHQVMNMVEEMVSYIAQEVMGTNKITYNGNEIDLSPPWRRITLREVILQKCGVDFEAHPHFASLKKAVEDAGLWQVEWEVKSRGKLIDKLISTYIEPALIQPTFVLDYPVEISPLAKRKPANPELVERFEAFVGGMEIANAFTELNDPIEQRQRFKEQLRLRSEGEEGEEVDEEFLHALEYGLPPTGGLGMGIDRLVMLFTDQPSIREVILFPQLKSKG
jgi:lysyl-tRNA synthetase class 2